MVGLRATLLASFSVAASGFQQVAGRGAARRMLAAGALPPHLQAAREEVDAGTAILCDVREPGEWESAHLKTAIHVPLSGLQNGQCPPEVLDATKRLYLHCAAGIRVYPAADALAALGCDDVVPLKEGAGELYQLGFDVLAD